MMSKSLFKIAPKLSVKRTRSPRSPSIGKVWRRSVPSARTTKVGRNLYEALLAVRRLQRESKDALATEYLWADALCINQADRYICRSASLARKSAKMGETWCCLPSHMIPSFDDTLRSSARTERVHMLHDNDEHINRFCKNDSDPF